MKLLYCIVYEVIIYRYFEESVDDDLHMTTSQNSFYGHAAPNDSFEQVS